MEGLEPWRVEHRIVFFSLQIYPLPIDFNFFTLLGTSCAFKNNLGPISVPTETIFARIFILSHPFHAFTPPCFDPVFNFPFGPKCWLQFEFFFERQFLRKVLIRGSNFEMAFNLELIVQFHGPMLKVRRRCANIFERTLCQLSSP